MDGSRQVSHDQNFKNLIIDYPLQAIELFSPEEAGDIYSALAGSGIDCGYVGVVTGSALTFLHVKTGKEKMKRFFSHEIHERTRKKD